MSAPVVGTCPVVAAAALEGVLASLISIHGLSVRSVYILQRLALSGKEWSYADKIGKMGIS